MGGVVRRLAPGAGLALVLAGALAGAAFAQMDPGEEQRCVWRCLADSPGAESRQYQDCVERMCVAGQPAEPARPRAAAPAPAPKAAWAAGGRPGGSQFAGVEIPGGRSFRFVCPSPASHSSGMVFVAGMDGRGGGTLEIDGKSYRLMPLIAEKGPLIAIVTAPLLRALMGGSAAQVRTAAGAASFPLAGSGAAIRTALAGCGMKP